MSADKSARDPNELAAILRERAYITFTAVAVITLMRRHAETAFGAAKALFFTITGSVVAGLLADLLAHVISRRRHLTREERRHEVSVAEGGLLVMAIPMALLILAHFKVLSVEHALDTALVLLACSLGAMAFLAYRHLALPFWKKVRALTLFLLAALTVIGLEQLAHT